jgi:hypothetical protein
MESNWISGGPGYSQISLTDGCSNNICDANPVYSTRGDNDNAKAIEYCKAACEERDVCEGFFF